MSLSRYAKTRLSIAEYVALCARADECGMTVSEYLRKLVENQHEQLDIRAVIQQLEAKLVAQPVAEPGDTEVLLVEVLFLVRELVAVRNAQALSQVAQRVRALYPERRATV